MGSHWSDNFRDVGSIHLVALTTLRTYQYLKRKWFCFSFRYRMGINANRNIFTMKKVFTGMSQVAPARNIPLSLQKEFMLQSGDVITEHDTTWALFLL